MFFLLVFSLLLLHFLLFLSIAHVTCCCMHLNVKHTDLPVFHFIKTLKVASLTLHANQVMRSNSIMLPEATSTQYIFILKRFKT